MKSYKSKSHISKKSLYLAIVFVVVSTVLIVAVSFKRSFDTSKGNSLANIESSSAVVPTNEFKQGVKKPEIVENVENNGDRQPEKEPSLKPEEKPAEEAKPVEPKKKAPVKKEKAAVSKFVKPLEGSIIQEFSNNELVFSKTLGEFRTHNGIDIEALPQTPVKSVCDGVVVDLYNDAGRWGTCLEIKHDSGVVFVYRGLGENLNVKLESKVKAGEIVGMVGKTNAFEGALDSHLHLEAKKGDDFVDPLKYIKQGG